MLAPGGPRRGCGANHKQDVHVEQFLGGGERWMLLGPHSAHKDAIIYDKELEGGGCVVSDVMAVGTPVSLL